MFRNDFFDDIYSIGQANEIANAEKIRIASGCCVKYPFKIYYKEKSVLENEILRIGGVIIAENDQEQFVIAQLGKRQLEGVRTLSFVGGVEYMPVVPGTAYDVENGNSYDNKNETENNTNKFKYTNFELQREINSPSTSNLLSNNRCSSGCIYYPNDVLWYSFVPKTTDDYVIFSEGNCDTIAVLYDYYGTKLAQDDDSGEKLNFKITHRLTEGNIYYLRVWLCSEQTGDFFVGVTNDEKNCKKPKTKGRDNSDFKSSF